MKNRSRAWHDLLICVVTVVLAFVFAGLFDLSERWRVFSAAHEDWELDEVLVALGLSSLALIWFAFRRWREARDDAIQRRQLNIELRKQIEDREAAEEKLRQAQKMEAVGHLTGGIAHDFNNLLAVILGNAEFLSDRLGPDDEFLNAITRSASRGAALTDRLLAFSRRQPLRPTSTDLSALVAGMSTLLSRSLGESISVESKLSVDLWHAWADAGQLENALLNLALNARDAMPQGGALGIECFNITLGESALSDADAMDAGDYVVLSVSDQGSGMSDEVKTHAFEPFYTTKEVGEGSGLGLSMVFGFAKQSGGHVTIYSELGEGTTVNVYLPRATETAEGTSAVREAAPDQARATKLTVKARQ